MLLSIVRIFRFPFAVLGLTTVLAGLLVFIEVLFQRSPILAPLVAEADKWIAALAVLGLAVAIVGFILDLRTVLAWQKGEAPCCDSCGGLAIERTGRFGGYRQCAFCGRKQST